MVTRSKSTTASLIRQMAQRHNVSYVGTGSDRLAHHMSRLADSDVVELDEIERLLIGLQRAGHLSRTELIRLQASYLNETKQ